MTPLSAERSAEKGQRTGVGRGDPRGLRALRTQQTTKITTSASETVKLAAARTKANLAAQWEGRRSLRATKEEFLREGRVGAT